jgi:hypothetical protein
MKLTETALSRDTLELTKWYRIPPAAVAVKHRKSGKKRPKMPNFAPLTEVGL